MRVLQKQNTNTILSFREIVERIVETNIFKHVKLILCVTALLTSVLIIYLLVMNPSSIVASSGHLLLFVAALILYEIVILSVWNFVRRRRGA